MSLDRVDAWLLLALTPGLGPTLTRRCVETLGSPQAVVDASATQLAGVEGIGRRTADTLAAGLARTRSDHALDREKQLIAEHGVTLLPFDDPAYPGLLQHIPDPPPLLYLRGRLLPDDAVAIGVVGSRKCTAYGREQADRLSALCCGVGLTVVSGGAYGIDTAAHHAALRVGGRTIAVLGSGLAKPYPAPNRELFDRIVDSGGAVVSELPMNTPPTAEQFPRRNRIISGLSLGILVIEAARRSGALITARLAAEEHGREVLAVPGRVDSPASDGCHDLIRKGHAALATNLEDILDSLGETGTMLRAGRVSLDATAKPGVPVPVEAARASTLSESQQRILQVLAEPLMLDQLVQATGLPVPILQADLTVMQIRSLVRREGTRYRRH